MVNSLKTTNVTTVTTDVPNVTEKPKNVLPVPLTPEDQLLFVHVKTVIMKMDQLTAQSVQLNVKLVQDLKLVLNVLNLEN